MLLFAILALPACSSKPAPGDASLDAIYSQQTIDLPSRAQPAFTPGSPGVVVDNPKLLRQFDGTPVDLNKARYTRYFLNEQSTLQADVIVVAIPGFEGGASNYAIFAENLMRRAREQESLVLEVWAFDRRSNQLEDTIGLDIAEGLRNPQLGLDFLFGDELGLSLSQELVNGPNRRAIFYNSNADTAYMAQWTTLVHSLDIDAVINRAHASVRDGNVFLAGHSAGTGYAARYAATDLALDEATVEPGYEKVRGLVLLEGGGGRLADKAPDAATLDLIEARFDGGLYGAVRDQAPRCSDGVTACTVASEATDCAALENRRCVEPELAYAEVRGLLSPQLLAVSEVQALDAILNGESTQTILQLDQSGEAGNNAIARVPELAALEVLLGDAPATSSKFLGQFIDDDGVVASLASFVATSVGFAGPEVNGLLTWLSKGEIIPAEAFADNGPAPTSLDDAGVWGLELEPSDLEGRMLPIFYQGQTNFSEWYYSSSGLGVTSELGLDTSALSLPAPQGRGRSDIDNRTQARNIDIPVIAFGGSNGLTPVPASWLGFADAIAPCAARSCDGSSGRILDRVNPNTAFPTFGGVGGGFEVHIAEGYAHLDVLTADDDQTNTVIAPLLAFIKRNID
jgi:pimeloyl-ACP methyl ester carboxylesterase